MEGRNSLWMGEIFYGWQEFPWMAGISMDGRNSHGWQEFLWMAGISMDGRNFRGILPYISFTELLPPRALMAGLSRYGYIHRRGWVG